MIKIVMIVPEDIVDLSRAISQQYYGDILIEVVEGSMNTGYEIAKVYENKGFNAIIARGGTQILIKNSDISIPTIPIPINVIDVFEAIKEGEVKGKEIAILAFNNMIAQSESFMKIAGTDYKLITVNNEEEVEEKIKQVADSGISVIIGGAVITKFAKKYNIIPIVLKSGKESILSSIEEAKRVASATNEEKKRVQRLRAIVENTNDGIILVNRNGTVKIFNSMAEKLLNKNAKDIIGKNISSVINDLDIQDTFIKGIGDFEIIKEVNDNKVLISNIPIEVNHEIVDVITIIQDVNRIQQMEEKIRREIITTGFYAKYTFEDMVGKSSVSKEIIRIAKDYSKVNSTVLIEGETGTGKEVMAQSIHNYSHFSIGPFVAVNCAAFPENLLESELFGYAPGSFTGADRKGKRGLFELAHGGTIFLDEICEMNPVLQGRLLRVLQEKHVMRIGDNKLIPINVRVITASNKNLHKLVLQKKFRDDLFYRINVLKIDMPSLREKREDIPYLMEKFISEYSYNLRKPAITLSDEAIEYLKCYNWPGNVRELRNFVERLMVITKKDKIELNDIKGKYLIFDNENFKVTDYTTDTLSIANSEEQSLSEKEAIIKALKENRGVINFTAETLGMSRTTLWRKIKKYNLKIN